MRKFAPRFIMPAAAACLALVAASCSTDRSAAQGTRQGGSPASNPGGAVVVAPAPALAPALAGTSAAATRPAAPVGPRVLGEHWVQDWRIRAIMQRIAIGANPAWPKNLPDDPERTPATREVQKGLSDAAALAESLATAASELPSVVANRPLSDEDRRDIAARAQTLRRQSLDLKEQALAGKVEQVQRTLNAINATCFDCHVRHRDLSGVLEGGRASLEPIFAPRRYAEASTSVHTAGH